MRTENDSSGKTDADRVHVMESTWVSQMNACSLFAYRLPTDPFQPDEVGGFWVSEEPVEAIEQLQIQSLFERHAKAGIELRVTPSVRPFWEGVVKSTVEFSGHRLHNATSEPM